jgi:hypothetical protein
MAESADSMAEPGREGGEQQPPWQAFRVLGQVWADIQRALGFGVMRASAPLRNAARSGGEVFARARLESARIKERYSFFQEISQNPASYMRETPTGHIELTVPYDGDQYFTRQAYGDVVHARHSGADPSADALVGYLALTDHEHTNLDSSLNLEATYGSAPIRVPLRQVPGPREADPLVADGSACVVSYDYRPGTRQFAVDPVYIDVELDDLDTAGFSSPKVAESFGSEPIQNTQAKQDIQIMQIMQRVSFRPELLLRMTVLLHVRSTLAENAHPEVSQVSLDWPTHTSLRSLDLRVAGQIHPLRYNPQLKCLEWSGIPMVRDPDPVGGEIRTFRSPEMDLSIPQPGELYQQESLNGLTEVTVDRLLSGMDARLYDATGQLRRHPRLELESIVSTQFSLILDDAFGRRTLSPYQQLHFDEVIPSEMRIHDIKTALGNLGFTVDEPWSDRGPEARRLSATRIEGPDTLQLELYIEGKLHKARRQRRVPGGVTYRTDLESGELRIYIYGSQPRDSQQVVHEMNALRWALRERFDRLPARR